MFGPQAGELAKATAWQDWKEACWFGLRFNSTSVRAQVVLKLEVRFASEACPRFRNSFVQTNWQEVDCDSPTVLHPETHLRKHKGWRRAPTRRQKVGPGFLLLSIAFLFPVCRGLLRGCRLRGKVRTLQRTLHSCCPRGRRGSSKKPWQCLRYSTSVTPWCAQCAV